MTRKTKNILAALTLSASMAVSSASALAFTDVDGAHWANVPITSLNQAGYINGYADGSFAPDSQITRAEFVTIINNIKGGSIIGDKSFTDLSADAWYYNAIMSAVGAGYISGYDDNTVRPDAKLTRAEAAVIAYRAWGLDPEGKVTFADSASIGDWCESQIATMASKNIITGYDDNTFRPNETITRAEVATIIYRLIEMEKSIANSVASTNIKPNYGGVSNLLIGGGGSSSGGTSDGDTSDKPGKPEPDEVIGDSIDVITDSDDEDEIIEAIEEILDVNNSNVKVKEANVDVYVKAIDELDSIYDAVEDEESAEAASEATAIVVDVVNDVVKDAIDTISGDEELTEELLDEKIAEYKDVLADKLDDSKKLSDSDIKAVEEAAANVYDEYYGKIKSALDEAAELGEDVTVADIMKLLK